MHGLENVDSNAMEMDDELSWVDVREVILKSVIVFFNISQIRSCNICLILNSVLKMQVPPEDIIWRDGEAPYF